MWFKVFFIAIIILGSWITCSAQSSLPLKLNGFQCKVNTTEDNNSKSKDHTLYYYWVKAQEIKVTQGGANGLLLHGDYIQFYPSNQLKEQGQFNKGLKTNTWKQWWPNGNLKQVTEWRNGRKDGDEYFYNYHGELIEQKRFRKGELKNHTVFSEEDEDITRKLKKEEIICYEGDEPNKVKKTKKQKPEIIKIKEEEKTEVENTKDLSSENKEEKKSIFHRIFNKKKMIKASALAYGIIISMVMATISSAFIWRNQYNAINFLTIDKHDQLINNSFSGIQLLLSEDYTPTTETGNLNLFNGINDTVLLQYENWGIYQIGVSKAYNSNDTVQNTCFIGRQHENDGIALYLADQNSSLAVCGETILRGKCFLPKRGVKRGNVKGHPYTGKEFVYGVKDTSTRELPSINVSFFEELHSKEMIVSDELPDSLNNDFSNLTMKIVGSQIQLEEIYLSGKIIIESSDSIIVHPTAQLHSVILSAPKVVIQSGFKGNIQVFTEENIQVEDEVHLTYPSVLGTILKVKNNNAPTVSIGNKCIIEGVVFDYTKDALLNNVPTIIKLGKSTLHGILYASNQAELKGEINGKVICKSFLLETPSTKYQNHLIDVTIDRSKLFHGFSSGNLFNTHGERKEVLKWV